MSLWDNVQGKWPIPKSNYADMSGNGNTLTANGAPTATTGHGGGANLASSFNGTTQYLSITNAAQVGLGITGNITISSWIIPTAVGTNQVIVSKLITAGQYAYDFYIDTNKNVNFRLSSNGTLLTNCIGATALTNGTTYHVVGVYNGTDIRVYVNGVLDSGVNNPKTYSSGIFNGTDGFGIGGQATGGTYFTGAVEDVAVWSRALSAAEVSTVYGLGDSFAVTGSLTGTIKDKNGTVINCSTYNVRANIYPKNNTISAPLKTALVTAANGAWSFGGNIWSGIQGKWMLANTLYADMSGNANTLSVTGVPTAGVGHGGGANMAVTFGSGKCVQITNAAQVGLGITGSITIVGWIYVTTLPTLVASWIVGKLWTSGQYSYDLYVDASTKNIIGRLSNNGTALTNCQGGTQIQANKWYQVALVYNGTDIRIYLNGVLDTNGASNPKTYSSGIFNGTDDFTIGAANSTDAATHPFNGSIQDVAVFNRALSADEIAILYNEGDGFSLTGIVKGIKYLCTFEYEGNYAVLNQNDIAGADFITAA